MNTCKYCYTEFEQQPGPIQVCPRCGEEIQLGAKTDVDSSVFDSVSEEIVEIEDEVFEVEDSSNQEEEHLEPAVELLDSDPYAETELPTDEVEAFVEDENAENRESEQTNEPAKFDPLQPQPTIHLEDRPVTASTLDYAEREIIGLAGGAKLIDDADYVIEPESADPELGSGATGVVFRARQKSLDRPVAIKLLKKQLQEKPSDSSQVATPHQKDVDKFLYESQITAGLDHPNVITVHDLGVTSNNTLFYSMKMFEGGKDWDKAFNSNSIESNLDIFHAVCDAMRRAHRDRIIHRDLKPQNVMLGEFGEVQVTDWGLALDLRQIAGRPFSGGGTPCYMAPEMSLHYLVQQDIKDVKKQLNWARINNPTNNIEIATLAEQLTELEEQEQKHRHQINELSDVYVMGAILFHIASGFPPHLFQLGDNHRSQWGESAGKEKTKRELKMSADGMIAHYVVKDLGEPEAREALKNIAMKAMNPEPRFRIQSIDLLQKTVRQFREFLVCIEETYRGDREVNKNSDEESSYVNLNKAIHAYEGALNSYPDYKPARVGLSKARFLFAEKALKNQDFELGLSTMTEEELERQPNRELASELRAVLVGQRTRRDRRKQLLFFATMASLVAIALGSAFAVIAFIANSHANTSRQVALKQEEKACLALEEVKDAKGVLIDSLTEYQQLKTEADSLRVESATAEAQRNAIKLQTKVATAETALAQVSSELIQQQKLVAGIEAEISAKKATLASLESVKAQIAAERIKQNTQFSEYLNRLKSIESNIGDQVASSEVRKLLQSQDVSLPIKNAWELHHLFKQANPGRSSQQLTLNRPVTMSCWSADGSVGVVATDDNQLYRLESLTGKVELIAAKALRQTKLLSLDISADGNWLIVAPHVAEAQASDKTASLPLLYHLQSKKWRRLSRRIANQLQFSATGTKDTESQKEKYFCQPQYVQFLETDDESIKLFLVDRRVRLGVSQFRCSSMELNPKTLELRSRIKKTKVTGQVFRTNPGLLTNAGCLVSATTAPNGETIVAISNSQRQYGVVAFSLDRADAVQSQVKTNNTARSDRSFLNAMNASRQDLREFSSGFTPTAINIAASSNGSYQVLIGSGKGEIVSLDYQPTSSRSALLGLVKANWLSPKMKAASGIQFVDASFIRPVLSQVVVRRARDQWFANVKPNISKLKMDRQPAAHNSVVRSIVAIGEQIFTSSETELLAWSRSQQGFEVTSRLFGQQGNLATSDIATANCKTKIMAISNLSDGRAQIFSWVPQGNNHRASIVLDNFRSGTNNVRKIVEGAADSKTGSESIVLAFDDGTFRFFDPSIGQFDIDAPQQELNQSGLRSLSPSDFRNGQFSYFSESNSLVMYSNSAGLLSWQINDESQTEPIRHSVGNQLFRGKVANTSNFLSSDSTGKNIVTSHPVRRDQVLLWQRNTDNRYVVTELDPFNTNDNSAVDSNRLNIAVESAISPDGNHIACVARYRNAYQVRVMRNSNHRQIVSSYDSDRRTNFRSLHFLNDQRILISQDQSASGRRTGRTTSLIEFVSSGNDWQEQTVELPKEVDIQFEQLTVSDATLINGKLYYTGFGIPKKSSAANKEPTNGERRLICWNETGVRYERQLPFSRRISPRFDGDTLAYLVQKTAGSPSQLESVNIVQDNASTLKPTVLKLNAARPVRSWAQGGPDKVVAIGSDWFYLADTGRTDSPAFSYSLTNAARRMELAGNQLLIHHRDDSVTLATLDKQQRRYELKRLEGLHSSVSISPDGAQVATVSRKNNEVKILPTGDARGPFSIGPTKPLAVTWVRSDVLKIKINELKPNVNNGNAVKLLSLDEPYVLATLSHSESPGGTLQLDFWQNGKRIKLPKSLATLKLPKPRNEADVESFEISNASGELVSVVWKLDSDDRANVWKWTNTDDPTPAKRWFSVDLKDLGRIESVDFSEVVDPNIAANQIAPRIVISNNNSGGKSIRLYALDLDLQYSTRLLLDLFVTDKLQTVDELVGARFSGDGKTLLTMTTDRANLRMSDGWNLPRRGTQFDQQIREFQSTLNSMKVETVQAEINDLQNQLAELSRETMQKLQQQIADRKSDLDAEQRNLQTSTARIAGQMKQIEMEIKAKSRTESESLGQKIKSLKQEIGQ